MPTSPGREGRRDPDALIARAGVRGSPSRDQHFLVDDRVLDRLVTYAEAFDRSHVLEIGAGTGGLTDRLLGVADRVTAIERDARLAGFLRGEFADAVDAGRLDVVEANALEVELPAATASVSNLPYGIASELLFRLLPRGIPLLVMVQREFADRMAAAPESPDYGRLSVTTQHSAAVEVVESVPPAAFDPQPPVESALVRLTPAEPTYEVADEAAFLDLVRAVFTQRRKTMRNALRNTAHISGIDDPEAVIAAADRRLMDARPGELAPADFAALADRAAGRDGR